MFRSARVLSLVSRKKKHSSIDIPSPGESTDLEGDTVREDDLTSSAFDKWMKRMVFIASKAEAGTPIVKKEKTSPSAKPKPQRPKKPERLNQHLFQTVIWKKDTRA